MRRADKPGDCRFTRVGDDGLLVEHADAYVWIATEFLDAIYPIDERDAQRWPALRESTWLGTDCPNPWISLQPNLHDHTDECGSRPGQICYFGWLMNIKADNRTVVYRIASYLPQEHVWQAAWPD